MFGNQFLVFVIFLISTKVFKCAVIQEVDDDVSTKIRQEGTAPRMLTAMDLIVKANLASGMRHLVEGDIVPSRKRNAVAIDAWKWKEHKIPYIIDKDGFSEYGLKVIKEAVDQFNSDVTCIKYVPRTKEADYVRITHGYGCHSSIGLDGGRQDVTLGDNCYYKGVIMHELNHAVGFFHEQSRWDRDKYVRVNMENVMDGKEEDFRKEERNILDTLNSPYDYGSVMHYGSTTFSKNGKPTLTAIFDDKGTMGQRDGFSAVDIWKINKLYGCQVSDPPDPVWMIGMKTPSTLTMSSAVTPTTPTRTTPSSAKPEVTTSQSTSTSVSNSPALCQPDPNLPSGIFGPPKKFDVAVFQNSLRVYWSRPCYYKQLQSYQLTYWTVGGRKISMRIDPSKLTHYIATALHPGKKFYMTIAAVTPAGIGPTSPVISTYSACGQEVVLPENGSYHKIHSPYLSKGYYESDVACQWTIKAPKGQRLKVVFDELNLVTGTNCDEDVVIVNDVIFCSNSPQKGYIFTDGSTAKITFVSQPAASSNKTGGFHFIVSVDGIKPKNISTSSSIPGFIQVFWAAPEDKRNNAFHYELKYRLLPDKHESAIHLDSHVNHFPITTGTHYGRQYEIDLATVDGDRKGESTKFHVRTACGRNISAVTPGLLHTPHFPASYEPDTVCEWHLLIEDGYELSLTFNRLDLETTPDCLHDYVEISGAGRFCTTSDLYGPIALRSDNTRILFVSNGSIQGKGLELLYEQKRY